MIERPPILIGALIAGGVLLVGAVLAWLFAVLVAVLGQIVPIWPFIAIAAVVWLIALALEFGGRISERIRATRR